MRLVRLYLDDYRILQRFTLTLERSPSAFSAGNIALLAGVNGTGKSTCLSAIARIFIHLERSSSVPFLFELEYLLTHANAESLVKLSNIDWDEEDHANRGLLKVFENGAPTSWTSSLLPDAVLAFTSGSEEAWTGLDRTSLLDLDQSPGNAVDPLVLPSLERPGHAPATPKEAFYSSTKGSRFTLVQNADLSLVTLCAFIERLANPSNPRVSSIDDILQYASVGELYGFSLRFRTSQGLLNPAEHEVIRRLRGHATRAIRLGADRLLVFVVSAEPEPQFAKLLQSFSGAYELFRTLSSMRGSGFLSRVLVDIQLMLKRLPVGVTPTASSDSLNTHLFDWLSDGERSFVGRMCLPILTSSRDTLLLLDEPEVHFNDVWKRQMVGLFESMLAGQKAHLLITTHSSITLSDLPREQIRIFQRRQLAAVAVAPSLATFGGDPGEIMVNIFGEESAVGSSAVQRIRAALENRPVQNRQNQIADLELLAGEVATGYWKYRILEKLKELRTQSAS